MRHIFAEKLNLTLT